MLEASSVHPNQGYYSDKQPLSHTDQPQLICYHNFYSHQFRVNGIIQIILGVICIIFNSVSLGLEPGGWGVFAQGFWSGAFYVATGAVGVAAANKKTKCEIIGFMVLCIITASVISPGALVTSLFGCITYQDDYEGGFDYKDGYENARLAFQIIMGLMPIIQFAMAIWGAVISCKAVCGSVKMITPMAITQLRGDQQFVMQNSDGKFVPYQGLPSHPPQSGYNVYGGQQY